jgi:hypothetical protein
MNTAKDCIEIVEAIEVLEYHNMNYLSHSMAEASLEKISLLRRARELLNDRQDETEGVKEIAAKCSPAKDGASKFPPEKTYT